MTLLQSLIGLHALWQFEVALGALYGITVILGTALLVHRHADRLSPAVRHRVLSGALLLACVAPLTTEIVPVVPLAYDLPAGFARLDNAPHAGPLRAAIAPLLGAGDLVASTGSPHAGPGPIAWLAAVWLGGVAILGCRLIAGFRRVRRTVRRGAVPAPPRIARLAAAEGASLALARHVDIRMSNGFASPLTLGVRRPVVLLPAVAEHWSDTTLRAAIRHELAHVERRDWMAQMLGISACVLFWFHPFAWSAARAQRRAAELAADARVLDGGPPAGEYARVLYDLASSDLPRRSRRPVPTAVVALSPATSLEARIRALSRTERSRVTHRRWPLFLVVAAGFVATGLTAPEIAGGCQAEAISVGPTTDARPASNLEEGRAVRSIG